MFGVARAMVIRGATDCRIDANHGRNLLHDAGDREGAQTPNTDCDAQAEAVFTPIDGVLYSRLELSSLVHVDSALMRERPEPEDAVIAAHAALIDTTERQLVFQVMGEKPVDRHAAR
jgi:hypothetical protein